MYLQLLRYLRIRPHRPHQQYHPLLLPPPPPPLHPHRRCIRGKNVQVRRVKNTGFIEVPVKVHGLIHFMLLKMFGYRKRIPKAEHTIIIGKYISEHFMEISQPQTYDMGVINVSDYLFRSLVLCFLFIFIEERVNRNGKYRSNHI